MPTAGILRNSDILIIKSSDIVLASNIDYTIQFVNGNALPQNGRVVI